MLFFKETHILQKELKEKIFQTM